MLTTQLNHLRCSFFTTQIKAIFPITQDVNKKMIEYIKNEIAKEGHDGFEAKDVNINIKFLKLVKKINYFENDLQLAARFTISVVSNSIYNVDPESFKGKDSEILKTSQTFTAPTKRFIIIMMLTTVYPFLKKILKLGSSQPGAENFFIDLMSQAIKNREESTTQSLDYLDHLMNLKRKKEISGEFKVFKICLSLKTLFLTSLDLDLAAHGASFLVGKFIQRLRSKISLFNHLKYHHK